MSDFAWAKVFCELPRDPKLSCRPTGDRYLFVCLILLARESKEPGVIDANHSRVRWLAEYTGLTSKQVRDALVYFDDEGMVLADDSRLVLANFAKRQAPKDPTAAARQKRLVDRKQGVSDAVSSRVSSPQSHTVEDRGQKTEKNEVRRGRATPAPDVFPITDDIREYAKSIGFQGDLEWERDSFLTYHRAKGSVWKSWGLAFESWLRRTRGGPAPTEPEVLKVVY